jgi:hypothetical protein
MFRTRSVDVSTDRSGLVREQTTPAVVTISAGYGAGGGIVGPIVARELGIPFVDRSIPTAVSASLAVPLADAMAYDERAETGIGRVLSNIARSMPAFGPVPEGVLGEDTFRQRTEQILHETAGTTGGVILGRAGMIVLAAHPRALHVCLHGPEEARVRLAVAHGGTDEAAMRDLIHDTDRGRDAYFRHFYRCDPDDPTLYHLAIDSTALELDTCAELVVLAARAKLGC